MMMVLPFMYHGIGNRPFTTSQEKLGYRLQGGAVEKFSSRPFEARSLGREEFKGQWARDNMSETLAIHPGIPAFCLLLQGLTTYSFNGSHEGALAIRIQSCTFSSSLQVERNRIPPAFKDMADGLNPVWLRRA